jgi:O-antigen/teichoic acid export membrane protein
LKITVLFIKNYNTVFYNIGILILSLLQTVLITKFFSQNEYGIYGFYISLSQIILIGTQWGFNSWGVNKLTQKETNDNLFESITVARFTLGVIIIIPIFYYLLTINRFISLIEITAILIYFISVAFSTEIIYISENKIDKMVRLILATRFMYTVVLFILFLTIRISASQLFLLFSFQNMLICFLLYKKQPTFKLKILRKIKIINQLKVIPQSTFNFFNVFSSFLYASGPVIFSGHILEKKQFSIVYASTAIIKMIQAAYQPMIQKILPKLNSSSGVKIDFKLALIFSLGANFVIYLLAPHVVKYLFNENYEGLVRAIRIFSFSLVPGVLSTIILSQIAIYYNYVKRAFVLVFIASIGILSHLLNNREELNWETIIHTMLIFEIILFMLLSIMFFTKIKTLITENP